MKAADVRHGKPRALLIAGFILAFGTLFGGGWPDGCSKDDPRVKSYIALSPVAVVLPKEKLRQAAEYYARLRPNAVVLKGDGEGMMPLYAPGTLLVMEPISYDDLKEGMTAVYREPDGTRVAHYLVVLMPDGWTTRGLNEKSDNLNPMTRDNYIGVIVMAFAPETPRKSG